MSAAMKRRFGAVLAMLGSLLAASNACADEPAELVAPVPTGAVSLSLREALERVDRLDPQLRQKAFARAIEAVNLRRARWSRVSGNVSLSGSESVVASGVGAFGGNTDVPARAMESHAVAGQALVRVPLYAGGAIDAAIEAAEARVAATGFERERTRQELRAAATRAYAELAYETRAAGVARRAAERAERLIELASARVRTGVAPEADLARAELNALRQREDVALRTGNVHRISAVLRAALLLEAPGPLSATDSLESLARLAREQTRPGPRPRPDLEAQRQRVVALEGERTQAFAGYLPRLELVGMASYGNGFAAGGAGAGALGAGSIGGASVGGAAPAAGAGASSGAAGMAGASPLLFGGDVFSGSFVGALQLSWNVWDFFVTRDNVARVDEQLGQTRAGLADAERRARRERDEALALREQALARLAVLEDGTGKAHAAVALEEARYRSGTALLSEVIQSELQAIDVELRAAQAAYDLVRSHVDLLLAEGRSP